MRRAVRRRGISGRGRCFDARGSRDSGRGPCGVGVGGCFAGGDVNTKLFKNNEGSNIFDYEIQVYNRVIIG
ncbi:hypothetical protein E2562_001157 [Oryza meyeriana var. granulata]|uniref:Uncharacterized protein n=1 Tax=Oryza meyeriana var. granulata TaxID=110450 RepID=A0A6G1ED99_9ORYZ|nr:hypothetical protein E2562_001157 [Oryza meyeriana var. granulata]